jgi:hypothetical protein
MRKLLTLFPLQFRVLCRQFFLRVIDLEALSIQADIPRFLGQFAGVLILFSLMGAFGALVSGAQATTIEAQLSLAWRGEQRLISSMMLVVGLFAAVSWDSIFPDRLDAMVLSPLPVAARTILLAKIAASAAIVGIAVLALNVATGIAWPLILGHGDILGFLQSFLAYWFTMIAASVFLYCLVLVVQGFTALLLPRWLFLRLSALLQLAAFGLFLGIYFLQPLIDTPAAIAAPENQRLLAWSPSFWFFALFNQLNGSLPAGIEWLASRAWVGFVVVLSGATASLFFCYRRTLQKTIEEPDLVPASGGLHRTLRLGGSLQTAILLFSLRSLIRSRQHRVIFAFYLAGVFALAFSSMRGALLVATPRPLTMDLLISTFVMMSLAVVGLRSIFSLPISLNANWILRITQLDSPQKYIAITRRILLVLGVLPVWLISAGLLLLFSPLLHAVGHLVVLALLVSILADLCLIDFCKIPFTCSYLPGKVNIQFVFWGFLIVFIPLAISGAEFELRALLYPVQYVSMTCVLGAIAIGLWAINRHRAKSAVLYFEELPQDVVLSLGLASAPTMR